MLSLSLPIDSQLASVAGSNSTRNLANLSKLFRQLRPHLLQTMTKDSPHPANPLPESEVSETPREKEHEMNRVDAERGETEKQRRRFRARVEFALSDRDEERVLSSTQCDPQLVVSEGTEGGEPSLQGSGEFPTRPRRQSSAKLRGSTGNALSRSGLLGAGHVTESVGNVLADSCGSYSSLSNKSQSELTSSWESFTKPVPMFKQEHRKERTKGREGNAGKKEGVTGHRQPTRTALGAGLPEQTTRPNPLPDGLLRGLGRETDGKRGIVPKSRSAPDGFATSLQPYSDTLPPLSSPSSSFLQQLNGQTSPTAIRAHKRRIAEAVDSVHNAQKLFKDPQQRGEGGGVGLDRGWDVGEKGSDRKIHETSKHHQANVSCACST